MVSTAQQVADQFGISASTVKRNARFSVAVDYVADALGPAAVQWLLRSRLPRKTIIALGRIDPKSLKAAGLDAEALKHLVAKDQPRRDPVATVLAAYGRLDELDRQRFVGELARLLERSG